MGAVYTLLFVIVATGAGLQILRWLRVQPRGVGEALMFGAPIGLGTAAYGVLALGLSGRLSATWLLGWVSLVALLGLPRTLSLVRDTAKQIALWAGTRRGPDDWAAFALVIYCLTMAVLTGISALAPPADLDYDSLTYHLAAPRIYLRDERIHFIAYDSHTNFPFTMQMLYVLGLEWGGPAGAKVFHWSAGWLTALAVAAWLRSSFCSSPSWAAPLGAAMWISIPLVIWESGTAYVDLGTALFQFAAFAALLRAVPANAAGQLWDTRWSLVAGILSGFAIGTKYTALIQAGALGAALLLAAIVGRNKGAGKAVLSFGLAAAVIASPWYLKNILWTNNPVYPFLYPLFPNSVHWNMEFHLAYQGEQRGFGRGDGWRSLLQLPWDLAFHGRHFFITTQRTLSWDKWAGMGVLAVGFAPLFLYARRLDRQVLWMLAYLLFSIVIWLLLSQQSRYLLPLWAVLTPAIVACILALPSRLLRGGGLVLASVQLVVGMMVAAEIALVPWVVVSGAWTQTRYLREFLPHLYLASEWVNANLPSNARLAFLQETRGFYFDRPYLWANPGQNDLIPYDQLRNGAEFVEFLKRSLGVTHILVNLSFTRSPGIEEQQWWKLLLDGLRTGRLVPVFEAPAGEALQDQRGVVILELR